jgi:hypothetical protein
MTTTIELNVLLSDICNIIIFKYWILCLFVAFKIPKPFCYKRRFTVIHAFNFAHSVARSLFMRSPWTLTFIVFFFTTLSVTSEYITSDFVRLVSNKLERIWNEVVVA